MVTTNELLIQNVFNEMLNYKPTLQRMLFAAGDEEESLDPRLLGDLVIKNFPWPINMELFWLQCAIPTGCVSTIYSRLLGGLCSS